MGPSRRRPSSQAAAGVVGLITILSALLFACGSDDAATTSSAPVSAVLASDGSTVVLLRGLVFEPKAIIIPVGTRVDFTWKEQIAHNVIFEDGVKSKIQTKGTYSRTFEAPGTYPFQCTLHPGMRGTVVVE